MFTGFFFRPFFRTNFRSSHHFRSSRNLVGNCPVMELVVGVNVNTQIPEEVQAPRDSQVLSYLVHWFVAHCSAPFMFLLNWCFFSACCIRRRKGVALHHFEPFHNHVAQLACILSQLLPQIVSHCTETRDSQIHRSVIKAICNIRYMVMCEENQVENGSWGNE
jgi:hypothetical protein